MKAGSINGISFVPETVKHDHLDDLATAMTMCKDAFNVVPALWKADIDAAFRRIPLKPEHRSGVVCIHSVYRQLAFVFGHRWAAGVAYKIEEVEWVSFHTAMPFGATASVYAWHRVGALIGAIARRLFKMPIYRYVDDYFASERPETAEHSMQIFARLVRMLLGPTSISNKKLEWGNKLQILGMCVAPEADGIRLRLDPEKARKWIAIIDEALLNQHLDAGAADKLSGRLMWGTQHLFHRCIG